MQNSLMRAGYLLTALIIAGGPTHVAATPLNPFRYEAQAQRHWLTTPWSGSISRKRFTISKNRGDTDRAALEVLSVRARRAAAASIARCLGFVGTHDRPRSKRCACWAAIARQIAGSHLSRSRDPR